MDRKPYDIKRELPVDIGGKHASDPGLVNEPKMPLYLPEVDGAGDETLGNRWPYVNGITLEHRYYSDVITDSLEASQQMQSHIAQKMTEAISESITEHNHNNTVYVDRKLYGVSKNAPTAVQDFVVSEPEPEKAGVLLMNPRGEYTPELIYKLEEVYGDRIYEDIDTAVTKSIDGAQLNEQRSYHDVVDEVVAEPVPPVG